MTNTSNQTITDEQGTPITVGSPVRAPEGLFEPDPGEGAVLAISDFDADVDDDTGRGISIPPRITVRWADGTTEDYATFGWDHTPVGFDADGDPLSYDSTGVCEELVVITGAGS